MIPITINAREKRVKKAKAAKSLSLIEEDIEEEETEEEAEVDTEAEAVEDQLLVNKLRKETRKPSEHSLLKTSNSITRTMPQEVAEAAEEEDAENLQKMVDEMAIKEVVVATEMTSTKEETLLISIPLMRLLLKMVTRTSLM